ncbi:MAG: ASCH domain-containing protein [Desulfoprunum sp.]
MEDRAVLISINPEYAEKILSGEKKLEFRRSWGENQVKHMVIYATSPHQKIVAVAEIKEVHRGSRQHFWKLAKEKGGGISRRRLFNYLKGSKNPVAIELTNVRKLEKGLDPKIVFGVNFRPPQSFNYLNKEYMNRINNML